MPGWRNAGDIGGEVDDFDDDADADVADGDDGNEGEVQESEQSNLINTIWITWPQVDDDDLFNSHVDIRWWWFRWWC